MREPTRFPLARILLAAALLGSLPSGVFAQEMKQAMETADEAKRREEIPIDEGEVSYEQVMADPDNVELNYRFARTQVKRGDVKGSAATLERILLVNPALHKVRLFYGIVLYRLDNNAEAKRELLVLQKAGAPANILEEADKYLKLVEKREKRTRLSGRLGIGWQYDTNRNASPASGERLFLDTPLTLSGSSLKQDDTSVIFLADIEARRDLGFQAGHEAFLGYTYYRAEQTLLDAIDLQVHSFRGGGVYKAPWAKLTPSLVMDHVLLSQSTYLRNWGGSAKVEKQANKKLSVFFEFRDVYQDYVDTQGVPVAEQREGVQIDLTAGGSYLLSPTMKLGASLGHTMKNAKEKFNAFDRNSLNLNHSWLLGRGAFLLSYANYNRDAYQLQDSAISRHLRRDESYRLGATAGAPLTAFHRALAANHAWLRDFVWTFTLEYYQATSSIRNYSYTNNQISTMLTYRWELGF